LQLARIWETATIMADEVLFLFNHDAPHQVAHIAVSRALYESRTGLTVTCATATPAIRDRVAAILGAEAGRGVTWLDIGLPGWLETALALPNKVAPVRRLMRLRHHAGRINAARVVVSAERTCLSIRDEAHRAGRRPLCLCAPWRGRPDGLVPSRKGGFDRILVRGQDRARTGGARRGSPEKIRVVGYPKFDTIDLSRRERLFENDNPVFVYNPHFDPLLSSWYDHGPALLDWFLTREGQAFNIIFAPHIMLFKKKLHVSLEYRTARLRPDLAPRWHEAANILIDTGSTRLVDMTYTLSADGYIGDVSSQIYEFLVHPRPCCSSMSFPTIPARAKGAIRRGTRAKWLAMRPD
jgi:hypothetical protein